MRTRSISTIRGEAYLYNIKYVYQSINIYNISPTRARRRACDINIMIPPNSHDIVIIIIIILCVRVVPVRLCVLCILLQSCNVYDHVVIIILLSYTLLSADYHHRLRLGDWRR